MPVFKKLVPSQCKINNTVDKVNTVKSVKSGLSVHLNNNNIVESNHDLIRKKSSDQKTDIAFIENNKKIFLLIEKQNTKKLVSTDTHFQCNFGNFEKTSFLTELTIEVILNNVKLTALLDSGSQSSIISKSILNKLFPNWRTLPEVDGPQQGIGVDGTSFEILSTKVFYLKIGNNTKRIKLSVPERGKEFILGLDILKTFRIRIYFEEEIKIFCDNSRILSIHNNKYYSILNMKKCTLRSGEKKFLEFVSDNTFKDNDIFKVHSHPNFSSVVVPCLVESQNNSFKVLLHNTSNKKRTFKINELRVLAENVSNNLIIPYSDTTGKVKILQDGFFPIPFYNKENDMHSPFYKTTFDYSDRFNFLNNIVDGNHDEDTITLDFLKQLPGLELPDIHFPLRTPETIVSEDLEKKLSSEQKAFLISEFLTYPSLISQYSYDVGRMKDYRGQPIFMDVKLSSPLPFMKKAYKLSEEESKMMNDVLDFLIFYRLGEEASPNNQTGAPAFLVNRSSTQRAARLIIDTRFSNKFLAEPVSCHPTTILDPLRSLVSNCTYVTALDCSNAFYSIRLSKEALDSNISQIYTPTRCVRLFGPPTGLASIPNFWTCTVNRELNLDDNGCIDPLTTMKSWFFCLD